MKPMKPTQGKKLFLFTVISALICSCSTKSQTIYEWRGPDRSGIYPETELLKEWPKSGPHEIWALEDIGNGYGSPTIDGNHLYITGEIDSMAILHCLTLDGKKVWETEIGKEWSTSYPGSRSAPTIVGEYLYTGTGMGNLYCIEKANGEIVWSKDFEKDFEGIYPLFGHSEAPLIDGDKVFWTPGGEIHNVVALNRYTGEIIWSNPGFKERSGYNQPKLIEIKDRKILATFSAYHLMGLDTESGELLWSQEQDNVPPEKRKPGYGDTHSNTVLFNDGAIYYAAGDGNCGVKLQLSVDGSSIEEVWRNKGFDSYMGGIVKIGNYIYGGGTAKRELHSINATSGVLSDSLKIGSGSLIAADDMLYYYNHAGKLFLVSYDNGQLKELSSFKIRKGTKEHFSHPVIHKGVLYLRHGKALMAFDIADS